MAQITSSIKVAKFKVIKITQYTSNVSKTVTDMLMVSTEVV